MRRKFAKRVEREVRISIPGKIIDATWVGRKHDEERGYVVVFSIYGDGIHMVVGKDELEAWKLARSSIRWPIPQE